MDDNNNIVYYIVLGIIYLLSRVFGKKKKKPLPKPASVSEPQKQIVPPTAEKEEAPPMSFEDILRELSGTTQPKPAPEPVLEIEPEREVRPSFEPISPGSYSVDEMDEIAVDYEVPKPIGYNRLPEPDPFSIKRKKLEFERDDHFKIRKKETTDYLSLLSEHNGAAKAFVMSEIFERKY